MMYLYSDNIRRLDLLIRIFSNRFRSRERKKGIVERVEHRSGGSSILHITDDMSQLIVLLDFSHEPVAGGIRRKPRSALPSAEKEKREEGEEGLGR